MAKDQAKVLAVKDSDPYKEALKELKEINDRFKPEKVFDETAPLEDVVALSIGYANFMLKLATIIQLSVEPCCGRSIVAINKANKILEEKYGARVTELLANPPRDVLLDVFTQYTYGIYKSYKHLEEHYKDLVPRCIPPFLKKFTTKK